MDGRLYDCVMMEMVKVNNNVDGCWFLDIWADVGFCVIFLNLIFYIYKKKKKSNFYGKKGKRSKVISCGAWDTRV